MLTVRCRVYLSLLSSSLCDHYGVLLFFLCCSLCFLCWQVARKQRERCCTMKGHCLAWMRRFLHRHHSPRGHRSHASSSVALTEVGPSIHACRWYVQRLALITSSHHKQTCEPATVMEGGITSRGLCPRPSQCSLPTRQWWIPAGRNLGIESLRVDPPRPTTHPLHR